MGRLRADTMATNDRTGACVTLWVIMYQRAMFQRPLAAEFWQNIVDSVTERPAVSQTDAGRSEGKSTQEAGATKLRSVSGPGRRGL